jgi:GNAT superfamily N-acetyltransferase
VVFLVFSRPQPPSEAIHFPSITIGFFMLPIITIDPQTIITNRRPSSLSRVKKILSAITQKKRSISYSPKEKNGEHFFAFLNDLVLQHNPTLFHLSRRMDLSQFAGLMEVATEIDPALFLSVTVCLDQNVDEKITAPFKNRSISQIQWQLFGNLPQLSFFKSFSKIGVWNHLIPGDPAVEEAMVDIAELQPNIIHSWERFDGSQDVSVDPKKVYDQVYPLPGRPLRQWVRDPLHRLALLSTFGKTWLLRSRVKADSDRIYEVGESMAYHFCPPDQLPSGHLDEICAMVAAGGTVATTHVRYNLERAHLIGYVQENGVIVGNSSLKNPRSEYIETVRRQSGLDLTGYVERGYTSVRPEYRGLGIATSLLEGLTRRAGDRKIFSVISEDNEATKIIAKRNRTRKVATYFSNKAGKPVGIWMPEWMIDK